MSACRTVSVEWYTDGSVFVREANLDRNRPDYLVWGAEPEEAADLVMAGDVKRDDPDSVLAYLKDQGIVPGNAERV